MARKGFVFTLYMILAMIIAGVLITSSYFFVSEAIPPPAGRQNLFKASLDILAVLEKSRSLEEAVEAGSSRLQEFLNATPKEFCGNITVYDHHSGVVLSTFKNGCNVTDPVVSRRVFVQRFSSYYAELRLGLA